MTDYQNSMFERAESDWLEEPERVYAKCCEECGGLPDGDFLYLAANGKWCCEDCALESLEKMYIDD